MLKNNNQQVIQKLAMKSLRSNRRRSLIMLMAVVLSVFMLFSVLTTGITYFKLQKVQDLRLNGGQYDAIMYGLTKEQRELCENNPDIMRTGILVVCGSAEETEKDKTPDVGFVWADDVYWNEIKEPAVEWVKGNYPILENEVMVTENALKASGLEGLKVGDSFTMKYSDAGGSHTKEFCISGIWEGYGDTKTFYMSKAFFDQSGYDIYDTAAARYHIDFEQKFMTQKEQDAFIQSMKLGKQQNLFFLSDYSHSTEILLGMAGIILITCFCAYLLIYNILYISVSGNVRYYGLLQTVGMTGKQIYRFMHRQMLLLGFVGTAAGLVLGGVTAFFLIPIVVSSLGIRNAEIPVLLHPAVFFLTVVMSGVTVYAGSRKPVRMAVSISPIEALGYRIQSGRKRTRKAGAGRIVLRMAEEQIKRDKKKTAVVILSLSMSLCVFLCMITLLKSQGPRTIVGNYMDLDLVVKNDTLKQDDRENWKQIMDEKLLGQMEDVEGVKEVHAVTSTEIMIPWEPDFADMWMEEMYDMWMRKPYEDDKEEYQEHPENFGTFMVGIDETDLGYLNERLEKPIDIEDFLAGETCIIYRNGLDFTNGEFEGKKVTCTEYENSKNAKTFEIAGLTDESYYTGALLGLPPTLIVSDWVVRDFVEEPYIFKVGIQYATEYDTEVENSLMKLQEESSYHGDFSHDSKIEELKTVEEAQGNLMGVGMGIVLILALIGILNYVNTMIGSIQSCQKELAILESIGMTEKQVSRMLVTEGVLFAGISMLLTAVIGLPVTYYLYQLMNYRNVPFVVPAVPMLIMAAVITLVCVTVPLIVRKLIVKTGTVVERVMDAF